MSVIPAMRRLRHKDHEVQGSLGSEVRAVRKGKKREGEVRAREEREGTSINNI
jgi:hypothetical protein